MATVRPQRDAIEALVPRGFQKMQWKKVSACPETYFLISKNIGIIHFLGFSMSSNLHGCDERTFAVFGRCPPRKPVPKKDWVTFEKVSGGVFLEEEREEGLRTQTVTLLHPLRFYPPLNGNGKPPLNSILSMKLTGKKRDYPIL